MGSRPSIASRTLTVAGIEVARVGLGTNRLTSKEQNHAFLREAVDAGLGMIDTAHVYTSGDSERAVGAGLSPKPDRVVIATKGGYGGGATPEALRSQIEQSFDSLRTDTIDLYYLHRIDPETPLADSLGVIAEYHEAGRIKEIGISAVTVDQIEAARAIVPIAAVQNHFNIGERMHDDEVDYCEENGIVFVPYYPVKGDAPAEIGEIARNHDASPEQIALAWLLHRSAAMLPIPGTLSIQHLRANLAALDIELGDDEYEALT
jgi:pyridoxine 4-dehydrogenase